MKQIRVVYTDNSTGQFYSENVYYNVRTASFVNTDGEHIVIPYNNVYIIRESEVKKDGSVRSD